MNVDFDFTQALKILQSIFMYLKACTLSHAVDAVGSEAYFL
jgi:hypothetical protein